MNAMQITIVAIILPLNILVRTEKSKEEVEGIITFASVTIRDMSIIKLISLCRLFFAVSFNTLLEILFKLTAYRYNAFVVKAKTKNCFDKRDLTKILYQLKSNNT